MEQGNSGLAKPFSQVNMVLGSENLMADENG